MSGLIVIKATTSDKNEVFNVKVDSDNYIIIRDLLIREKNKIINKFRTYKSAGLIGAITYPRNQVMQKELDELVSKKRLITDSIEKINKIFIH